MIDSELEFAPPEGMGMRDMTVGKFYRVWDHRFGYMAVQNDRNEWVVVSEGWLVRPVLATDIWAEPYDEMIEAQRAFDRVREATQEAQGWGL